METVPPRAAHAPLSCRQGIAGPNELDRRCEAFNPGEWPQLLQCASAALGRAISQRADTGELTPMSFKRELLGRQLSFTSVSFQLQAGRSSPPF